MIVSFKNKLIYHIYKVVNYFLVKIEFFRLKLFYFNRNQHLQKSINNNRLVLSNITNFLDENSYRANDYGIQNRIFQKLNLKISKNPTYSDLIVFLFEKTFNDGMNYLEIGCSVLKNFMQIKNSVSNSNLVCYDINEINPTLKDEFEKITNNNKTYYFKGDVLDRNAVKEFHKLFNFSFNFIFSDALHTEQGVYSEYELIYKDRLDKNFIIYFDDLDFPGVKNAVLKIKNELMSNNILANLYTFKVNGWIGNHEKCHLNGILTNLDISKILSENNVSIYKFTKE